MPNELGRSFHLIGRNPCDVRYALGRIAGAKLGVMCKHGAAGEQAVVRCDENLAFEGETLDGRAIAARRGVVGDGLPRRSVPGDEMTSVPSFGEIGGAQEPAVIGADEMRRVCPGPHELVVVPASAYHEMRDAERERPVGARTNAEPKVGLARKPDMARINDDELHPALERRGRGRRMGEPRVGGVVTPQDQAPAVLDVRHRSTAAAGGDAAHSERIAGREAASPAT